MAPKFVAPYRMSGKRGKNDAADAAALCEAVTRPNMRFVPVKEKQERNHRPFAGGPRPAKHCQR
jgi:transposase